MKRDRWPSTEEIVHLAFDASSRTEFRQEVMQRLMRVTRADSAIFTSSSLPPSADDVIAAPQSMVEASRVAFLASGAELAPTMQQLRARGVAIDTEIYTSRALDRMACRRIQRPLKITSNLLIELPTSRGATVVTLARAGGRFASSDADACVQIRKALAVADASFSTAPTRAHVSLTTRQREIASLIALGHTNSEIARVLSISPNTVRNHVVALFELYAVPTRAALAVAYAQRA